MQLPLQNPLHFVALQSLGLVQIDSAFTQSFNHELMVAAEVEFLQNFLVSVVREHEGNVFFYFRGVEELDQLVSVVLLVLGGNVHLLVDSRVLDLVLCIEVLVSVVGLRLVLDDQGLVVHSSRVSQLVFLFGVVVVEDTVVAIVSSL